MPRIKNKQEVAFLGTTVNVFGEKLWDETSTVCEGMKAVNTDDKPLAEGSDAIRALKQPGLYYQEGKFGLQLVCVFGEGRWGYAGISKDKDGEPRIDDEHVYDVYNVIARRQFKLNDEVLFEKGFESTKAYPAS